MNDAITNRTSDGRFGKGNAGGPGNPHAKRTERLRTALLRSVTPQAIERIVNRLLELVENGSGQEAVAAAKLLLDRTMGKPKIEVEVRRDTHLTLEQRRTILLQSLGVDDEPLRFGIKQLPGGEAGTPPPP